MDRAPIRYARSGDVNVAYQVTGEGPFDLVLVHGFYSHLEVDWDHPASRHMIERLSSFSRLIRFDKRGTGLSDRSVGMPDFEARMDDMRVVMDAVGSERAALFGYSEGGPLNSDQILDEVEEFLTGVKPAPPSARVLATVLFTDVVGSTEKVQQVGDHAWADLLERHNDVVRRELARFGCEEIDTAGDGFLALGEGPTSAIRCALSIRDAVTALGLSVRAGVHTGEVERPRGGSPRGIAVHIGARVAAAAGANEVFVSSTTNDLIAGSGIELEDRGEFELKGVGRRRLYAATA